MANPQKRTYSTVFNALKQISDEEGIDFGLDGYNEQQFKDKYFTGPGNINNLYNKLSQISDEEGVDFGLGTRGEWLGSFGFTEEDAMPKQGYKPTSDEMAGFQNTIKYAGRTALDSFDKKLQNLRKRQGLNTPSRIEVGKSNNLVQGEQRLNPETGKLENTYITSFGNEYKNETLADMEQRQIDQNLRDQRYKQSLPGQLDDAYAERDRLNAELEKLQGQWVDQDGRIHYGNRANDEAAASLEAALRQNQQRITALEAERDDDGGTQFWRGFIDAAKNPSNLTFGMTDFSDMMQMMRIKNKIDTAIESGQQPQLSDAEQALMESSFLNNYAQSEYGENRGFMYRAGGISMQALPFVAEFMATGGMGAISQKGAELGTRAAEKLALQGLSRTLVKNLGVLAGDVAAGWAMANTTGIFRTAGDVMQRNLGDVTINPEGQYDFGEYDDEGNYHHGGKSLGRSIYEAEVANTLEYYTEKLGEHLQIGKWLANGADKMGLSKLSKAVNYLSGSKWLERGGIQDYPSEVVEEEANLLLNGLLVGDNNFSVDPDSKEFDNSVFNPKTQLDIWGGMLFSIGLMQAPRLAYTGTSAAAYYAYKKKVDASDGNASAIFGADNWQMIKDEIDNCENDRIGELMQTVLDGDMTEEQKNATFDYTKNLIKMRGYNMGMMADTKSEEESLSEGNIAAQVIDQNYQMGHETQEPDLMKQYREDLNTAIQDLPQYGEEFAKMVATSESPVEMMDYLMQNRDIYSDDQIAAAADYYQKQARLNGVMDGALDRIDLQVEQANAEVRSNTHHATGDVYWAKGPDDVDYNIISGDIATDPDTGLPVLVGTGGAVVVKDPFGNISVKSPQELRIYSVRSAEVMIYDNNTELRQQLMQQADDDMTFGSPANEVYQLEDTVTLNDGEGNTIEGEIGMMPNSVDGVYVVYTPDGKALQYTADQLNRMIVAHNGQPIERTSQPPIAQNQAENAQNQAENAQTVENYAQNQPENIQSSDLDNAGGEASAESGTGANEQPASALSRIPVLQDEKGRPLMNKKGKPQYLWHKASVEDAAAALIETTGGDKLMARDTASDLVKNAQAGLEKIRKQKPKGDDPIEIAESRMEIRRQEQDQQAIIKQWQNVGDTIRKQMEVESAARQAEIEAAKSAEQKAREAEEARQREEKQKEIDKQRIREQIEKDKERRNKEYTPLVKAREEMAGDTDALAILNDVEPRSLEEWVSSLLRPHSMLWQDSSDNEIGLQSELGLKRGDMQRMMSLLGTKESGAKPFGNVVLDTYEALPEGMKNQYTDEDVRNTLLNLFNEGSSSRMMHLTEENRIAEANTIMQENLRREAEAEMEAWAEAYHLTPEERETYEDFLADDYFRYNMMLNNETEYINQIIADEEQNSRGQALDLENTSGTAGRESEGGEKQVQGQGAAETAAADQKQPGSEQGTEADTGEQAVPGDNVPGGTPESGAIAPSEQLKPTDLRDNIRPDSAKLGESKAERWALSEKRARNGEPFYQDSNGNIDLVDIPQKIFDKINYTKAPFRLTKSMAEHVFKQHAKELHLQTVDDAIDFVVDVMTNFDHIRLGDNGSLIFSVENGRNTTGKRAITILLSSDSGDYYGIKTSGYESLSKLKKRPLLWDGSAETPSTDTATEPVTSRDAQQGGEQSGSASGQSGLSEDKDTNNSANLQEKSEKSSEDIENEGEVSSETAPNGQTFMFDETGRCTNPNPMRIGGTALDVTMLTAYNGKGWVGSISVAKPLYFAEGGEIHKNDTPVFQTEEECRANYANQAIDELKKTVDGREELSLIKALRRMASAKTEEPSAQEPEPKTKRPGTNTPEGEILVGGGTILKNNMAGGDAVALVVGSNIDKKTGKRRYTVEYYTNEQEAKERAVAIGDAMIGQDEMRQHLANGDFSKERKAAKPAQPKKNEPKRLVSDEKMEELRKKLLDKLNNLNAGIDPEMMLLGAMYAVGNIERGVTKFADYAKKMVTDLGDKIRPYLKSFYNAVRDMPEAQEYASQMDDYATVSGFDVYNFDKQQTPDAITKAEHVVTEQRIRNKAKKIQEQPDLFAGDLFGAQAKAEPEPKSAPKAKAETQLKKRKPQLSDFDSLQTGKRFVTPDGTIEIARVDYDTLQVWDIDADGNKSNRTRAVDTVGIADGLRSGSITEVQSPTESTSEPRLRPATDADVDSADAKWYHNGKRVYILAVTRKGEQISATQFSKPTVESVMLTNGKSVKLDDLMVEDTSAIGETSTPAQIAAEEAKVDTNPSEAQKEAGNYQKGHIKIDGYDITIENTKGSIRRGTDASGKPWETKMHYTYGYIRGTEGVDGDHIDVFLSDNPTSGSVFVVDQVNPTTGEFDEHKCMYGFGSEEEAREAYLSNYSKGWKGLGNITEVSREDFKKWIESSHRKTKPFAEYKSVVKSQKKKSDWWNDPDRPQSIDPKDYKTYMTPEAKEYFAQFKGGKTDFTTWAHPNLAYITAAVWDEVEIPYEELKNVPEIVEAEKTIKNAESKGKLVITDKEANNLAKRLIDREQARQERKALVIIGLPAGGKSSVFANPLAKEFGARIIDSDDVKPWLKGFDGGNGAGFVQDASAEVAERAIDIAVKNGDNIIIPRIGGKSVMDLSAALRLAGYDVQLYFNDVKGVTSIDRAASRFAQTGRYLSLDYLTKKAGVPSENFSKFAEKTLGGYLDERNQKEVQNIRGRLQRLLGKLDVSGEGLREPSSTEQGGNGTIEELLQADLGGRGQQAGGNGVSLLLKEPLFNYSEWKSNDVPFGQKPKEIWNSESGKPMPGKKEEKNNETESKVSRKPESAGQGAGQTSGAADRTGAEPGTESDRTQRTGSGSSVENGTLASGAATSNGKDVQPQPKQNPKHNNRRNNVGERGKDYAPISPKARFNANVEAIKLMRLLNNEGIDAPTKDQMEVLRKYSGWGGMGTFFNDESMAENKQLRDLLSEEEYNDAVMSINSAYYTPAMVIDSLWDIAKAMGFKGGNVLEGSAGIGNIIGQMPKEMSSRSNIEAVEIDSISGNILKLLYPDAKVHIEGFQDVRIPNGTVDLAVTNVPFVTGLHVIDKVDKDLSRKFTNIHDFCIAKNIRKLSEGGIGIFITSAGTMDKSNKLREWITDEGQADVVGAFRLNNTTFGGTNVTSDIIVVRKRTGNQKSPVAIDVAKASPLRVGTWTDKFGDDHQVSMVVNDYFRDHPDMMAGEMAFGYEKGDTFRPGSYGLYPVSGKEQEKMLADFAKSMSNAKETVAPRQQTEQVQNQLTAEKEGRMLVDDKGRLCVSERGVAVPLGLNDQKVKGYTKQECFADYQAVQKAVDDVLQQQLNDPDDAALKPKLDALNKAYDKFTKRYGTLHKNTSISFLRNDIDFPSFQALENYSETKDMKGKVTVKTAKTPLFSQRVLGFKTEPKPKNVKDALIASIFRSNGIDLGWIAEKLNAAGVKPPHKDQWDEDDVRKGILVSRLGFEDPSTGQLEVRYKYLSGNVREKLAIAEAYNTDGKYASNIEELRKAVPMDIPSHLIEFSLGSSWIPIELYKDYLKENYDLGNVKMTHIEGSWILDEGYSYRNEKNRSAGVYSEKFRETIYGHQLVAAALNNRPVKVAKQVSEGYGDSKTTKTVVDQAATQACAVRVDEIKDDFKQFVKKKIQEDPELAQRIEKIYNDKFNALVPMQIDDEFLPDVFENANMNIHLYDHQKRGVMRGLTAPTMLAHEVGTGKSFTLISTAMEMRRLGTAKKPMIVVQNATVAQMTADTKLLYPNAKVLSLTEKDRDAEGRRAFYAKIKYNDWDVIIVPQSTFERIPDSPERELQFIQEKIDEKKHVIEAAEAAGADSRQMQQMRKELEKLEQEYGDTFLDSDPANNSQKKSRKKDAKKEAASLDKAETKAKEMLDRAVDDVQFFDDLGVDALLVDEAHEYKHLGFQTSIGRGIKGIDPSYSKKCAGLYNKTRSVFEKAGWKNVVFATGTPISNTAAEIWTFMKYLMPADVMKQNDIYYFDDFVHNFGAISQMLEFATSGKFKENTRFAAYVNKPELIRIWSQVADTVLTKEVGEVKSRVPEKEGGKDQDVFLPQSPSLISIMAAVRAELERFENMTGKEKKENSSIPLTMYGITKRAAIDPRLVNPDAPDEPLSKTNAAVKEIVKDLKDTQSYKGTVAVFCDNQNRLGKSADGKNIVEFNIYDDMRNKLIKAGVPAEQIAIIKSGMSITAKQKVFDAVNTGAIRVVLGSTQTLGTGVNMQERLHLLIHMDAPDRPMDYTQRNGRIERQGNLHKVWNKPVRILRFGVEDSLDVTAYQRLKTKSGFIDSIMDGKGALANNQVDRTVEEEEEGLFDNPVAVLSGSQYALKKNQAERELRKYLGKKAQWEADQVYVTNTLRYNSREVKNLENLIKDEEDQLKHIRSLFPDGKVKTVTVEGEKIDLSKGDADAYVKMVKVFKEKIQDPVNAIVKRNRENPIYNDESLDYKVELDGHPIDFRVEVYRTSEYDNGKMRTVIHKQVNYNSPDLHIKSTMGSAKSVRELVEDIMSDVVTGNDYTDRIDAYNAKISRLNNETEQLKKRVGMEFQYGKELDEAKKHVDEYTELMKKEMEEKEAKYAAQQKEAQESGEGFDLKKAEDNEDEEVLRRSEEDYEDDELISRSVETFSEGQTFPIYKGETFSSYNVLGHRTSYSTDLMPDEYATQQALLDALRNQYPEYYVTIEDNNVRMQSFNAVMADAEIANDAKKAKGTKSYVERKTRRAIDAVEDMANRMGLDVEVLTTTEGLSGKDAKAKGIFNKRTHKITIILPNHKTQSDVINTLLHEGVAHYGLRKMFGENFNIFLDNVYNNVDPQIKARIDAAMKRNGWSRHTATEEYLARLAERTDFENATNSGWWQKIKDFFISMLAKAGFNTILTDNELRYILWRSYDNLLHPDSRRNIFDKAREVDMMNRLKVGGYEERVPVRTSAEATTRVADRVNEEMLNRDLDNVPSQELLLSLSQKEGDERNEAIDELARRVGSGEARIVRLGEEMERGRRTLCHRVGSVLGSQFFAESEGSDETLGTGMHQRTLETERQKAKEELQVKNDILSWAKRNGYYIDEKEVERNSLDGKIFRSAAESNVYRTKDGKKVVKFMIVSDYYRHGLMKRLDDLALQNALLSDPVDVIGFSENKNGGLNVVLEQDYIEGDTVLERFNGDTDQANDYIDAYLTTTLGLREWYDEYGDFDGIFTKKGILYKDIHGGNVIIDKDYNRHIIDCQTEYKADRFPSERMPGFSIEDNEQNAELYSLRTKEPPKKTGIGYKVFVLKNGQLYPPMVANPNGEGTPIGVWLDADAAPVAGTSKTGRPQVKAGGKGTQGGSGQLAYRPGWHLGEIPYALQFNRKDANGERTLFPNNFVWAEVEYADDVDYNDEARKEGTNTSGKYQHSLAGLKHVPTDGSYKYRTNPDPRTDPWIITGAMRVNKILSREEVDELVRKAGREPQPMQEGDVLTQESIDALNAEIQAMKEADEMGLLYRDDSDDVFDIARDAYEEAAASDALKFQEAWQDKMAGLKVLQDAIEKETGHKATGAEDAYLYENRMHGKAKNQSENYDRRYYRPLLKAADAMMKAKGWTEIRDLTDYLVAKHGLERNIFYAFKAAITGMVRDNINKEQRKLTKRYERGEIDAITYKKEQKKLAEREAKDIADKIKEVNNDPEHLRMLDDYENGRITYSDYITNEEDIRRSYAPDFDEHYKDYSGLTELTGDENDYTHLALAMVDAAENDHQEEVSDLWNAINAATKETLRFAYESGTMSRNTYNNVRAMFNYYVPLRGWEENNADDYYDYVSERNVFSTAIKKAYGRQSLAENPLAYIGNMAVSTLLAGHRNLLKQHFLNYVMNNPTSLVSISERWWENKGTETAPYWVEVSPEIPAGATADEIADIVEAFNEEMKQKAEEGRATTTRGSLDIKYHATGAEKDEHMVEVQRAGKTYQLYINGNPKAAQALNGTNEKAVSRISQTDFGQMVEKINRSMAAFFTSKNPAFVLSNLSRDLTMAGASVAVKEDAAYNAQFIKNVVKVLRPRAGRGAKFGYGRLVAMRFIPEAKGMKPVGITGLLPSLMRKYIDGDLDLSNETERLFGEFMDEGGETGFVNMLSVDSFKEKMQKEIGQMNGTTLNIAKARKGTKETPVGRGLRLMGDIFEFYNRCAEDATRFIVYMTSRQMGKSLEDSIADAKDVTLNFNRKGTGAKWNAVVRDLFIFVNPAVQALANMFKMAYKHPLKLTAVTAAFMAGGALIPVFNQWLLNLFGDDDDKDAYWNLPPWVRKNNLVLWVPGTKNFITIPLAQEFRVFYGLGEMATSLTYDHPVHEWPMEILSSFMDLVPINPTGNGGNLVTDLTPTMFQPMSQLAFNTDFTGKPIWRENQGNKYAPMYTKAYVSTPEWMISLSEGINDLTGGNEGKKGWVEEYLYGGDYINNPAVWNHLMQGYFGGMYNTIAKTFDVGVTAAKGELPKVYQTPVLNRFLNRPVERDNAGVLGDEYYALTEERDRLKYELRTWQKKADEGDADAQEHVDEIMQSEDYQRMLVIDHYDKIMKDLKAGEKAAKADYDKEDIKDMITMFKAQMMDELADIDGGMDPLEAAKAKFNAAKTKSERARLSKRIERLTMRQGESKKSGDDAVDKALSYRADDLKDKQEGRRESGDYLKLATAENIADDARIRIAKQKIKQYTDEYKRLVASGNSDRAGEYRKQNQKYFVADGIIQSQSRAISTNKKLLGKGHDEAIMKLIDANRQRMLKAIEGLE